MGIAIIGWGSLIWDPQGLDIENEWHTDGPILPVEFARVSRGNRLTLVLVSNVPLQPTLWTLSRKPTLSEAVRDLAKRESTAEYNVGRWPHTNEHVGSQADILMRIAPWARERKLDAIVWTALGPKKPSGENGLATDEELTNYLRALVKHGDDAAAKEYVEKAPTQIKTPLRARIRRELGWKQMGE